MRKTWLSIHQDWFGYFICILGGNECKWVPLNLYPSSVMLWGVGKWYRMLEMVNDFPAMMWWPPQLRGSAERTSRVVCLKLKEYLDVYTYSLPCIFQPKMLIQTQSFCIRYVSHYNRVETARTTSDIYNCQDNRTHCSISWYIPTRLTSTPGYIYVCMLLVVRQRRHCKYTYLDIQRDH